MSRGFGGEAMKISENNNTVVYKYGGYNLNEIKYRNSDNLTDGVITIHKSILLEQNRSLILSKKYVEVKNCSNCWQSIEDIDITALHIIFKLFKEYQDTGVIPDKVNYDV